MSLNQEQKNEIKNQLYTDLQQQMPNVGLKFTLCPTKPYCVLFSEKLFNVVFYCGAKRANFHIWSKERKVPAEFDTWIESRPRDSFPNGQGWTVEWPHSQKQSGRHIVDFDKPVNWDNVAGRAQILQDCEQMFVAIYGWLAAVGATGGQLPVNIQNIEVAPENEDADEVPFTNRAMGLLKVGKQVILNGAPGTGKTYSAEWLAKSLIVDHDPDDVQQDHDAVESLYRECAQEQYKKIQFHAGYDYSDFVIGLKPRVEDGHVVFEWRPGILKSFADAAKNALDANWANPPKYVMVIDEINRADLSRVFGEVFSLIESSYRYERTGPEPNNTKNAEGVVLPDGSNFVLPSNLYFIGTMNDIDRSVESMDFALRRRFGWIEVLAEDTESIIDALVNDEGDRAKLKAAMGALNRVINGTSLLSAGMLNLGREYCLGGAVFAELRRYQGHEERFNELWSNHIEGTLAEYLRGNRQKERALQELHSRYVQAIGTVAPATPVPAAPANPAPAAS